MEAWIRPIIVVIIGSILGRLVTHFSRLIRERKKIYVFIVRSLPVGRGVHAPVHWRIRVVNVGKSNVEIVEISLRLKSGHTLVPKNNSYIPHTQLPVRLWSQSEASASFINDMLIESLKNQGFWGEIALIPSCRDSTDRVYKGKKIRIEVR